MRRNSSSPVLAALLGVIVSTTACYQAGSSDDSVGASELAMGARTCPELPEAVRLPGRVEAEGYVDEGPGLGHHDRTPGNRGGAYRDDDVDIEAIPGEDGFRLTHLLPGEWTAYDVCVPRTGTYAVRARVGSGNSRPKAFHLELDGTEAGDPFRFRDHTGPVDMTEVVVDGVFLERGGHRLRIVIDTPGFTIDDLLFEAETLLPLLENGDFEAGALGRPDGWTTGGWIPAAASFTWETGVGVAGSRAVCINATPTANDVWWQQSVQLEPDRWHNLVGWVSGEGIDGGSVGANLAILGGFQGSGHLGSTGTFGLKEMGATFRSSPDGLHTIAARLGHFGSLVEGRACFDELEIRDDDFAPPPPHRSVALILEREDLAPIDPDAVIGWASDLDDAYDAYAALVGSTPYGGAPIEIVSVRQYPGGWAVAGNPIRWYRPYVLPQLERVESLGDWSFGVLHELGHDFDMDGRWAYQGEVSANFKMVYVLEALDGRVRQGGVMYQGAEIEDLYHALYDQAIAAGTYHWNAFTYRLLAVKAVVTWTAFAQTYRDLMALPDGSIPPTDRGRFELFLDRLSANAGMDVRALLPPAELAWVRAELGP